MSDPFFVFKFATALAAFWAVGSPLQAQTNLPPQVELTHPPPGRLYTVGSVVRLEASATDADDAVVRLDFLEGTTLLGSVTETPYRLMLTSVFGLGPHAVFARATDTRGASSDSSPVQFDVALDFYPPIVAITAPLDGAIVSVPSAVLVSVTVDAPSDGPNQVTLYHDGQATAVTGDNPYTATLSNLPPGPHVLRAEAWDRMGNVGWSPEVHITAIRVALEGARFAVGVGFECRLTGLVVGHRYRITASEDLTAWFPCGGTIADSAEMDFTDSQATNISWRFYRALIED